MQQIPLDLLLYVGTCETSARISSFYFFNVFNLSIKMWEGKRLRKTLNKCHSQQICYQKISRIFSLLFFEPLKGLRILDIPLVLTFASRSFFESTDLTVSGLGMVHVTIPNAIQSGRNVIMTCDYELEDDDLYSVKWYKGKREFFRYTPKEIPSIKIFKLPGIRVDVSNVQASPFLFHSLSILLARLLLPYNIFYM